MIQQLFSILAFLIFTINFVQAQSHIYLTSPGTSNIQRIDHDGTNAVTLIDRINTPRGIELDLANGKMYFVDGDARSVRSANLDGTGLNIIVTSSSAVDLALDLGGQIIYFTDPTAGKIRKVNFDGSGLSDVVTGLTNPLGIDVDVSQNLLFWGDRTDKTIHSVNTDGTNSQVIYTSANEPINLALDKVNQQVYWVERAGEYIRSTNYDGSNVSTIAPILTATGLAIDNLNGKIYWAENGSNSLKRMNLDGSVEETVFSNYGLSGIALNINSLLPGTSCQTDNLPKVAVSSGSEKYTLLVHPVNNSSSIAYGGYGVFIDARDWLDGPGNTQQIVSVLGDNGGVPYAAKLCDDLVVSGCDDWYLPAKIELNAMFDQMGPNGSGEITSGAFWSSTETNATGLSAVTKNFFNGHENAHPKDYTGDGCRCVRKVDCATQPYDVDGDGFLCDVDCDDSNPHVYPGAQEICGNGIDDNCDGVIDENDLPEITSITLPSEPLPLGTLITASATYSDANDQNAHTARWDWGDGTVSELGAGEIDQENNTLSSTHTYSQTGVYTVSLSITDTCGAQISQTCNTYVVIYDPTASQVSGQGCIESPAGAYVAEPELTGRAQFGFLAEYRNGQSVPTGYTNFIFTGAGFRFRSTDFEWLVVAGPNAKFKGSGTVNNQGNYGFMLTGVDGDINGGGGEDKFRIKIWDKDNNDAVVYDNKMGISETSDDGQGLCRGDIKILKNGSQNRLGQASDQPVSLSAYPNPFSEKVTLTVALTQESPVQIRIFNLQGTEIRTLDLSSLPIGEHAIAWDGNNNQGNPIPNGIYVVRVDAGTAYALQYLVFMR